MNAPRILIVEDEIVVALDIQERLTGLRYEVTDYVPSGEQALAAAERQRPNLVLMDIRLQGEMDGVTAAGLIRERFRLPVVFLTANSEDATLERAKRTEPYGYILKPFDDRELKSTIEMALYKHQAEEEIRRLNRLYAVLSQVNQAIVRCRSRDELLPQICQLVVEYGRFDLAWIGWLDSVTGRIESAAQFGDSVGLLCKAACAIGDGSPLPSNPGQAIREGRAFICNHCGSSECHVPAGCLLAQVGTRSSGSFPIRMGGRVCGVLSLSAAEPDFFDKPKIELLEEVAEDISFALDKFESEARRQRAEEAARVSSEHWQVTFDSISDLVALFAPDGTIRQCNRAFASHFGPRDGEFVGQTCYQIIHRTDQHIPGCPLVRACQSRAREESEMTIDGRIFLVTVDPILTPDGQVSGAVHVMRDITEHSRVEARVRQLNLDLERRVRERTAELQAANRELDAFSYSVSHDLRAPLRAIDGFAGILIGDYQDRLDREGHRVLGVIQSQARHMGQLIDDLLQFARLGRQTLQKAEVDMDRLVGEVIQQLSQTAPQQAVEYQLGQLPAATGDTSLLRQVWLNLLGNALKFSRTREPPRIEISGALRGDQTEYVVRDNGIGFDMKYVDKLFRVFQRLHPPSEFEGTGVGLSLVQRIIHRHGGRIHAESTLDQGATFRFSLPLADRRP
jgi:PAS domain S-box-containing protein